MGKLFKNFNDTKFSIPQVIKCLLVDREKNMNIEIYKAVFLYVAENPY